MATKKIVLLGPAGSGKSTLFKSLVSTRSIQKEYYQGSSIDVFSGQLSINREKFKVIDTPGIYSLTPNSEQELITVRLLLEENPDYICPGN